MRCSRLVCLVGLWLLWSAACAVPPAARTSAGARPHAAYTAHVLGAAQDAGLPHIGCQAPICASARQQGRRQRVAALGLQGPDGWWLIDATPDLPDQIAAMGPLPRGIFLTHAHIGHYTGLMYLGREGLGAQDVPVWGAPRMASLLRQNQPWRQLVDLGQIDVRELTAGRQVQLDERLSLTPLLVPHRDELSETLAFVVAVDGQPRLLYVPDIDRWQEWDHDLVELARELDWLVIDGTFWSPAELPHRDPAEIPHPPVRTTMDLLQQVREAGGAEVVFTHLNHSNPLWLDGPERDELEARGFRSAAADPLRPPLVLPLDGD